MKTFRDVEDVVRLHHPEVMFLSETKSGVRRMESLKLTLNFSNCLPIYSRGLSGGISLFWFDDVQVVFRFFSSNHMDCHII